jgi:hypothetical protein
VRDQSANEPFFLHIDVIALAQLFEMQFDHRRSPAFGQSNALDEQRVRKLNAY